MMNLEDELRDLRQTVGLMSSAMAELLAWAKEVEKAGAVPEGSMERARKVVEIGKLRDELSLVTEALEALGGNCAPTLQSRLRQRVETLRADLSALTEELSAA
jgi:hypothetical protein